VAVVKASPQNFMGKKAGARRVNLISEICLCLRSMEPFCACVWGQDDEKCHAVE